MAHCPQCGEPELRLHATLFRAGFRPRFFLLGPPVPVVHGVALEMSCSRCLYAFIVRPGGVTAAPRQDAFDQLRLVSDSLKNAKASEREPAKPLPRPAPDPRSRKP